MGSADEVKHMDQISSFFKKKSRFHVYTGGMSWSFNQNFIGNIKSRIIDISEWVERLWAVSESGRGGEGQRRR